MVSTRLYVEGGGDSKTLKTACRKGFRSLVEKAGLTGRLPRIVATGAAGTLTFKTAHHGDDNVMLLVDAEGPVTADGPWRHLKTRDGWDRPDDATDEQCHLMVEVMESWFLADRRRLRHFMAKATVRTRSRRVGTSSRFPREMSSMALPKPHEVVRRAAMTRDRTASGYWRISTRRKSGRRHTMEIASSVCFRVVQVKRKPWQARNRGKHAPMRDAKPGGDGATTGYEAQLWRMADALRGSMDAAEYKHVVLGLIFLKYISDAFEERHAAVLAEWGAEAAEDRDEYIAENIFWVPPEARWANLKAQARQPTIGQLVDGAMAGIERDNPALKDVLPKDYARPALDKQRLGQLIDMISNIRVGDEDARSKDVLGRVYEYFLSQFASAEGKKGGEFYTPRCVVKLLVEMLEPYRGRVYDPCCGSSGMFVQSVEFIRAHASGNGNGGQARADISIYGQESNYTTWRLAKMNLAIRGIEGQIAHGDSFHNDRHPDLKADFILANPPFNVSDWGGERLTRTSAGNTASRPRATPTSPGCNTWFTTCRLPARPASCSPTAPCRQASRVRETSAGP